MSKVTDEMVQAFLNATGDARGRLQVLFNAKLISLPVDEAAIRESVVREAIAMFEYSDRYHYTGKAVCENLRSILTPKDRAEELVMKFWESRNGPEDVGMIDFARWLIEREG